MIIYNNIALTVKFTAKKFQNFRMAAQINQRNKKHKCRLIRVRRK